MIQGGPGEAQVPCCKIAMKNLKERLEYVMVLLNQALKTF